MTTSTLDQLERYLDSDPGNDTLRTTAFETALREGQLERAKAHLDAAGDDASASSAWGLRRAHWLIASRDWAAARAQLQALRQLADAPPALVECAVHDEALVALLAGEFDRGIELLQPWAAQPACPPAFQALWLRLLHRVNRLDEAFAAARLWDAQAAMTPEAKGVASLVALDSGDLLVSKRWSDAALTQPSQPSQPLEAVVARASIAMGEQDPQLAARLIGPAVQRHPADGRVRSAMAFTLLMQGQLEDASREFQTAVSLMPSHVGTWHGLGWCALLQRQYAAALDAFEKALALDRNFAETHGGLAVVHARMGQRDAAMQAIARAARLNRHGFAAQYAQAVLDGKADDADAMRALAGSVLRSGSRPPG
jgi:tetratricopeptide (TPR) repeat protein